MSIATQAGMETNFCRTGGDK